MDDRDYHVPFHHSEPGLLYDAFQADAAASSKSTKDWPSGL
jgi:hypothetical protein